jgi:hypothetical protein
MLMKLKSGLNFINILRTAFTHVDPKSIRIQSNPQYFFTLLGSTCAKVARKMLMKLTSGLHRLAHQPLQSSSLKDIETKN